MPSYGKNGIKLVPFAQIRPSLLDDRRQPAACDAVGRSWAIIWVGGWIQDTVHWQVSPPNRSTVRLPSEGWFLDGGGRSKACDGGNDNAANEMRPAIH